MKHALFLAGPGVPRRFWGDIAAEAMVFYQDCVEEGLYICTDFPARGLPAVWNGLRPNAYIGGSLKDEFPSEFAYHIALLDRAEKVYLFACARTPRQREWVNDFCGCAFAVKAKFFLHLY